ncbi:MAG TPA: hypothetical protein VFI93_07750 [Rhizomicrobium sp.]|nr:hypothetical protein [Rhizomicrobium sp.]
MEKGPDAAETGFWALSYPKGGPKESLRLARAVGRQVLRQARPLF